MKKLLILAAVLSMTLSAHAALLEAGMNELDLSGMVDFDSAVGTQLDLEVFYGYFFIDYLETGVGFKTHADDDYTLWAIGPGAEYNFDLGTELVPYVGADIRYAQIDADAIEETSTYIIGAEVGVKYFITEYLAISTSLNAEYAGKDIYSDKDGEWVNTDASLNLGMRVFF